MELNYFAVSGLINAATSAALGMLVFWRGSKTGRNITFALYCITIAVWSVFYFLFNVTTDPIRLLLLHRLLLIPVLFLPVLYYHFISYITDNAVKNKKAILAGYGLAGLLLPLLASGSFVDGLRPTSFGLWPKAGVFYSFHILMFTVYIWMAMYDQFVLFRKSVGVRREQMKYGLFAMVCGFFGGGMNYLPCWGINIPPYGNILVSAYVVILTYSITVQKLLDINLTLRYATIHALYTLAVSLPPILLMLLTRSWAVAGVALVAAVGAAPVLFKRFEERLTTAVDRLPGFRGKYERFSMLEEAQRRIGEAASVDELAARVVTAVTDILQTGSARLWVDDEALKAFQIKAWAGDGPEPSGPLPYDGPVPLLLSARKQILMKETVGKTPGAGLGDAARRQMEALNAELSVPIYHRGKLAALLNVGPKAGRGMYNDLDLSALLGLARAAEAALKALLMAEEMVRKERLAAMGEIAAVVGHEFRNALAAMSHSAYVLEGKAADAGARKHVGLINAQIAASQKIIGDILGFVRERKPVFAPASINDVAKEAVALVRRPRGVKLVLKLAAESPAPLLDREALRQAVVNLLKNAVEAMPAGGALGMETAVEDGTVRLSVSDTGAGIPADDLSRLFTPLFSTKPNGTGLGLMVVKSVAERHGGRVAVESVPGRGTVFHVWLPINSQITRERAATGRNGALSAQSTAVRQ